MPEKTVLVHCCCAHCAAYTVEHWRQQGYSVTALWYNPNIHPFTEHEQRLSAMTAVAEKMGLPMIVLPAYDMVEYFRQVAGHEAERCHFCFRLRLQKTAAVAATRGFDAFTTTLLISPHQKHDLVRQVGNETAEENGVAFLYADLRKRYSDSRHMTKPLDIYRQQYCGCVYSEWERYAGVEV